MSVVAARAIRDSASRRSSSSSRQASARNGARWLGSRSSAKWQSSLSFCHRSGVITGSFWRRSVAQDTLEASDHASEELEEGKRLGQVVVGAGVEALDDVGESVTGGEHEDGSLFAAEPEAFGDFEAVGAGEHDVEEDEVKGAAAGKLEGGATIAGKVDGVGLFAEATDQEVGHFGVVFDDQDVHGSSRGNSRLGNVNGA